MGSFSKMSVWPVGYFRAFSSWLLRNRRDVAARINTINAELARIGFVQVTYRLEEADGETKPTEERTGFSVTENSSLGRLCQAYVALGGSPLDISPFMHPDATEVVEDDGEGNIKVRQRYPFGGVVAPRSAEYNEPLAIEGDDTGYGAYRGGWPRTKRYYQSRMGGRIDRGAFDSDSVVRYMHGMRGWANQEIKERVQDIEWRIIKLCDLREQLIQERDEVLVQAFGGALAGVGDFDEARFSEERRVQVLVQDMYQLIFKTDEGGAVLGFRAHEEVPFLQFTFEDDSSEIRDSLGG